MIITALDFGSDKEALAFVDTIDPSLTRLKVGKELFTTAGPSFVEQLQRKGFDVFLDLKFHDIPNTVAGALSAAVRLGVWMVNVHASGGPRMLEAARRAVPVADGTAGTRLIAVTVLTSMDNAELASVGVARSANEQVEALTKLAVEQGIDGVVCSPREVSRIRTMTPNSFLTVTPGVRPANAGVANDDQRRTMSPADAVKAGSSYLVIGRPITQASNPLDVLRLLNQDVGSAAQSS